MSNKKVKQKTRVGWQFIINSQLNDGPIYNASREYRTKKMAKDFIKTLSPIQQNVYKKHYTLVKFIHSLV